ncbi:MAG TPA: hypothetical protein DCF68_07470 [Cyanothece sp. UBA12306]|nr:hypothetical protein [Cyanothece sp. UBA12306]
MIEILREATLQSWTSIYLRIVAIALFYGGLVHIINITGLGGTPWNQTPTLWRVMDIILLIFDLFVSLGLWLRKTEAIIAFFVGIILLQIVPYTVFKQFFVTVPEDINTLNGLIVTEIILMAILLILIILKK